MVRSRCPRVNTLLILLFIASSMLMFNANNANSAKIASYQLSPNLRLKAERTPCRAISKSDSGRIDWQSIRSDEEATICVSMQALERTPSDMADWFEKEGFLVFKAEVPGPSKEHTITASWMTSSHGLRYWPGILRAIPVKFLSHSQQIWVRWSSEHGIDVNISYTYK